MLIVKVGSGITPERKANEPADEYQKRCKHELRGLQFALFDGARKFEIELAAIDGSD